MPKGAECVPFNQACKYLNLPLSKPKAIELFSDADTERNGYLDFDGFKIAIGRLESSVRDLDSCIVVYIDLMVSMYFRWLRTR